MGVPTVRGWGEKKGYTALEKRGAGGTDQYSYRCRGHSSGDKFPAYRARKEERRGAS